MRVGYEGLHLVAINGDDEIHGTLVEIADCLFCSTTKVRRALLEHRKVRGYSIIEEWVNEYKVIDRQTEEIVASGRTKTEIRDQMGFTAYQFYQIERYGDPKYRIIKEKRYLWHK